MKFYIDPKYRIRYLDQGIEKMNILDKAKGLADSVTGAVNEFDTDEAIANTIIKAVEKQEKVNELLKAKGSNYRVSDIDLGMGIPPSVTFGVRRLQDGEDKEVTYSDNT